MPTGLVRDTDNFQANLCVFVNSVPHHLWMEKMKNLIFFATNWTIINISRKISMENGSQGLWEVSKTPMMISLDLPESSAIPEVHCHGSSVRWKHIKSGLHGGLPERSLFWAENTKLPGCALCQLILTTLIITGN